MQKILDKKSAKKFKNRKVIAYFSHSKIRLDIDYSANTESFQEMHQKRKPSDPLLIVKDLLTNGFTLANLGISVSLELSLSEVNKFAVFTRRGDDKKCLALISGYWDASLDMTLEACAQRELLEEFLVFQSSNNRFIVPEYIKFPYKKCNWTSSSHCNFIPDTEAIRWIPSAKLKIVDRDNCRIYVDATTSSAQVVYGYSANFSNLQDLSISHAEDRLDENNNLITYIENQSIVLFPIIDNRLINSAYYLEKGQLIPADLPEDSYFHPSMVGANKFGIVSSDKILLKDIFLIN